MIYLKRKIKVNTNSPRKKIIDRVGKQRTREKKYTQSTKNIREIGLVGKKNWMCRQHVNSSKTTKKHLFHKRKLIAIIRWTIWLDIKNIFMNEFFLAFRYRFQFSLVLSLSHSSLVPFGFWICVHVLCLLFFFIVIVGFSLLLPSYLVTPFSQAWFKCDLLVSWTRA